MDVVPFRAALALALLGAAACGDSDDADASAGEAGVAIVSEAVTRLPTALDLHHQVIARTCGPDGGVCHNGKEYPDLHTPGNLLDAIDKPCNLAEDDWRDVHDMCEVVGDAVVLLDGPLVGQRRRVAYHEVVGDRWVVTVETPFGPCTTHQAAFQIVYGDGSDEVIIAVAERALTVMCDGPEVAVPGFTSINEDAQGAVLRRVRGGDTTATVSTARASAAPWSCPATRR